MTAIDSCEPAVLRTFIKEGWRIFKKPFMLLSHGHRLYADFALERGANGTG